MTLRLDSVLGNSQRLDGGAMYGNAPRALWSTWSPPDEQNRIELACRCLLIREAGRTVLCETGIGAFFEPALRERFGVQEERHVLLDNLGALGVAAEDVDVVVFSHLHFDHAGGALTAHRPDHEPELAFPNAVFITFNGSEFRCLFPDRMPIFYMYSLKRGVAVKPWFLPDEAQ